MFLIKKFDYFHVEIICVNVTYLCYTNIIIKIYEKLPITFLNIKNARFALSLKKGKEWN